MGGHDNWSVSNFCTSQRSKSAGGVQSYFQHVAIGAVIILAITIDALRAK